ncbi:MAG: ABC transporter permease [Ignisphaera sp.]|nr:ABC transporter permease [Ignisphaera sp.]MDW8084626.1 ABC transporter permease [Ignisphaera sp.]
MVLHFLVDLTILAFKTLTERKTRAVLTIAGIAIGPLALVMITSVVDGYADYVIEQIQGLGQNAIVLFPSSGYKFTENDLNAIRIIDNVVRAEPFYSIQAQVKVGGDNKIIFVYAIPIDIVFETIKSIEVYEGNVPTTSEYVRAVVGHQIAFKDGEKVYDIGDAMVLTFMRNERGRNTVKRATVMVSAILKEFGGAFILSPDTTVFLPLEAGHRIFGLNQWSGIFVLARSSDDVTKIVDELRSMYRNSAEIISFQGIASIVNSVTGAMNFILFAASLSAFAVAIAGVAATMITSVIERTREIGVLKALGFTSEYVLAMILMESIIMSLIGGAIGITLGIAGGYTLATAGLELRASSQASIVIRAGPKITMELIVRTMGLTMLIGIAGGIFPAYRASKIPPAVALRYE